MPTTLPLADETARKGRRTEARPAASSTRSAIRRQVRITGLIVLALVGGVSGWASFTKIDGIAKAWREH
ncbi:hypothetical protein [Methylobacterium nigriterrae]|uniref:hypothetical protein n=1 Tax=Methylobacterium nigriterrae TaxID=3127512 RepID=UPI0030137432